MYQSRSCEDQLQVRTDTCRQVRSSFSQLACRLAKHGVGCTSAALCADEALPGNVRGWAQTQADLPRRGWRP